MTGDSFIGYASVYQCLSQRFTYHRIVQMMAALDRRARVITYSGRGEKIHPFMLAKSIWIFLAETMRHRRAGTSLIIFYLYFLRF
jgi:hypothetical protein